MTQVTLRLQQRNDTAANFTSENPTMKVGEIGYESDTGKWKWGDGATAWTSLAYWTLTSHPDVTLTSPTNGDTLKYNGTAWVNTAAAATGFLLDTTDTFTGILTVAGSVAIDNLDINGNIISSTSGGIILTALAGQSVTVEGVVFDGGVITSATSLDTSEAITAGGGVDKLTNATGVVSVAASAAPAVGQILKATSSTVATWQDASGGGEQAAFMFMGG